MCMPMHGGGDSTDSHKSASIQLTACLAKNCEWRECTAPECDKQFTVCYFSNDKYHGEYEAG